MSTKNKYTTSRFEHLPNQGYTVVYRQVDHAINPLYRLFPKISDLSGGQ